MTLLKTAEMLQKQGQDEDDMGQFDVWLETLTLEEMNELRLQCVGVMLDILDLLVEASDG